MKDVSSLFENGNDYLPTFITNTTLGTASNIAMGPVGGFGISLALGYFEQKYEDDYYRLLNDYMGSPMVYISNIIDKNAPNYKIEVQIEGLNDMGKPLGTSIYSGIAVRKDESNVDYENCDYKLQDHEVQLNESYYNANIEVETRRYYYLRPYTIVMVNGVGHSFPFMRNKYLWGGGQEPLISYGDVDKIYFDINASAITGDLITKTDKSAIVKCSYHNVSGIEGIECGVCVVNSDTGEIIEISTNSSDGEREINISGLTPATTYAYNAYIKINNTILAEGEIKTFTTDLPDVTGTWTCKEKHGENYETYTVTLHKDGTVTTTKYDSFASATWGRSKTGLSVRIHVITSYFTGSYWAGSDVGHDLSITFDDPTNPTSGKGHACQWAVSAATGIGSNYYYDLEMTK